MNIKIFTQQEQDGAFYADMGYFFAAKHIRQEMGGWQIYNKPNSTWFVCYDNDKVVGFCAMYQESTHILFDNFYVLPSSRGKGVSNKLFDYRMDFVRRFDCELRAITDNPIQMRHYRRHKFENYGQRGKYTKYRRFSK